MGDDVRRARAALAARDGLVWTPGEGMHNVALFTDEIRRLHAIAVQQDIAFRPVPLLHVHDERSQQRVVLVWTFGASDCPFLSDAGCHADGVKPLVCRSFPVIKHPGLSRYTVSERCPAAVPGGDIETMYPGEVWALRMADARMTALHGCYDMLRRTGVIQPRMTAPLAKPSIWPSGRVVSIEDYLAGLSDNMAAIQKVKKGACFPFHGSIP